MKPQSCAEKSGCIFISAGGQDVLNSAMPAYEPKIFANYSPSKLMNP